MVTRRIMAIKPVLREELQNSLHMLADYEHALAKLSKGSLIHKRVKGYAYYYLVFRDGAKVRFVYKGRPALEEIQQRKLARAASHVPRIYQPAQAANNISAEYLAWKRRNMICAESSSSCMFCIA